MNIEPVKQINFEGYCALFFKNGDEEYVELWDADGCLFVTNFHPTMAQLKSILDIYNQGKRVGETIGRSKLQYEIKKLLGFF